MNLRTKLALAFLTAVFLVAASRGFTQDAFRLKPGAKGKVCLKCHVTFQDKLNLPFLHTPVKSGDCSDCHNPHTSSHGRLLAEDPNKICFSCHDGIVPEGAQSVHKVAVEGGCVKCHDPHGARNGKNLRLAGSELCFSCHKEIAAAVAGNTFKHRPVEKGCVNCHNPHASTKAASLLRNSMPGLCADCHKTDAPAFQKRHMGYPVAQSRCNSCHDPHGSSNRGILWTTVHPPVVNRMCNQCHEDPSSPDALKTKKPGYELCRGCHSNTLNETFARNRMHWPVVDRVSCLNCHNPHAAREKALLHDSQAALCGTCHGDTVERQERSLAKHKPIQEGKCATCHMPHSSNNAFLLDNTSTINLCGTCHDWQKHSSHPIGEKVVDKRTRNLTLDCLSCHRSHGSEFKSLAHYDLKMDICVQCHEQFKR
jgi:predicted CXXCH cytochrome family protein